MPSVLSLFLCLVLGYGCKIGLCFQIIGALSLSLPKKKDREYQRMTTLLSGDSEIGVVMEDQIVDKSRRLGCRVLNYCFALWRTFLESFSCASFWTVRTASTA